MKKYLVLLFVLFLTLPALAQKTSFGREQALQRKNSVLLMLGGNGLFLSVSYDRVVVVQPGWFMDVSAGIGIFPGIAGFNVPHQIVFNKGKKTGFFLFGFGGTYEQNKTDASGFTKTEWSYYFSPLAGWKKIFRNRFTFGIFASPLIYVAGTGGTQYPVWPYAGISLGYSF